MERKRMHEGYHRDKYDGRTEHRDRRTSDDENLPKLYSIFKGQVASVQHYGVFVKIPFCKKQGLVHKSQISSTKVEKPEEVLDVGEEVWCKVISIEEETSKIGLSMKVVNQTSGKDTDPNHVQTALDEQRRNTPKVGTDRKKIELGAVFDTTCRKCGGKGHLAQDCFHQEGGEKYDLVPDLDFMVDQAKKDATEVQPGGSAKKHKKHKKEKKKHRRSRSSDSEGEAKKKHKKSEKKVRELSPKRRQSHSDSSDSDSKHHSKKHKSHHR